MKIYPPGVFHQVSENLLNGVDCTLTQMAFVFEAMEDAEEWAGEEQKRAEVAEARVRELEVNELRLSALICDVEFVPNLSGPDSDGYMETYYECPWCGWEEHEKDCPAFAGRGQVR